MLKGVIPGLRQGLSLRSFFAILVMAAAILLSSTETILRVFQSGSLLPAGYHTEFILRTLSTDAVAAFAPIAAVLPLAASYVEDVKSKFAQYFLVRSGYGGYIGSRLIACFLWGGAVVVLGLLMSWGTADMLFSSLEREGSVDREIQNKLSAGCLRLFLTGGFWAVWGMTLSTWMESKYIAYASSFVSYYLLTILHERYFPGAHMLYPQEWIAPSPAWPYGTLGVVIVITELTMAAALLFAWRARRRLEQL